MRRVRSWSCWSCVRLLFLVVLGGTTASHAARPKRQHDSLHWVAKAQITAHPLLRRDEGGSCPGESQVLCPASLNGGCCPSQYECATDSCYATTAGPTTACGKEGFFACGAGDSGGCCPLGYLCGSNSCTPPPDTPQTHTSCPFDYYLCPSSLNFGCCMTGMGCGLNECYTTTPVTQTITEVFTSTAGDETITRTRVATTISTPTPPTATVATKGSVPKFIPTEVPKISQIPTKSIKDGGGGGLSNAQLGGIVGGVVALLIIVIVATVLIIRHLKRVANAVESQKDQSGGSRTKTQSQAQMAYYGGHLHLTRGDDNRSIDPLMVTPNTGLPGSGTGTPQIGGGVRERSDSDAFSPLQNVRADSVDASCRHASVDSPSYFDLPTRPQNIPGGRQQMSPAAIRESADSHATGQYSQYAYHHWRQHSNASELSGDGSEALGSPIPELDSSGAYAELPGGGAGGGRSRSSSVASPRVSFSHARKRSESNGQRPEQASTAAAAAGFGPLDVVSESGEVMHGYYGPRDKQAGQTAAGLNVEWDISSPVAAARPLSQPMMLPTPTPSTPYTPEQQSPQPQQHQQHQYPQQPLQQEYHHQQQPQTQAEPYQIYQHYHQHYEQEQLQQDQQHQQQQPQQYIQQIPQQPAQNPQYPQQPQQPHYPPPSQ